MVGMTIGEERDLHVTFPEQYHAEDLKGKDAVFHVKLHAITREELPELDDEFAAEVSDFDTPVSYTHLQHRPPHAGPAGRAGQDRP